MSHIIFTKGAPGSGKSTFLAHHHMQTYVLCPDDLRLLLQTPQLSLEGKLDISMKNDREVWSMLLTMIERKMRNGELIIVDATHTKQDDFKRYKQLVEDYRYRAWVIDFSDVGLDDCIQRNAQRVDYKQVPEAVIRTMHQRGIVSTIPGWITPIEKDSFKDWLHPSPRNFDHYKKIHHIGDIQGCFTVLKEYFDAHPFKDDELYIFTGDYIDRGIENDAVVNFLLTLVEKKNVIFLEGNHDVYLWQWANGMPVKTSEFNNNTKSQLEYAAVDMAKVRNFCRQLRPYIRYTWHGKEVLVTHGGISTPDVNMRLLSRAQCIHGTGIYADYVATDKNFLKNARLRNMYSIHGHRNVHMVPTQVSEKCSNLEGSVEYGSSLRTVQLSEKGFDVIEIKNRVYKELAGEVYEPGLQTDLQITANTENLEIIETLRTNNHIHEKIFAHNLSSFNFKHEAFFKKIWNEQTVKARGLFVNTKNYDVVARSYEKFFNIGEMDITEYEYLKKNFLYPVQVSLKENGYLAMLGYNSQFDELVFATKSEVHGEYAQWFESLFRAKYENMLEEIKTYLQGERVCFVFEMIEPKKDPHIIEYAEPSIILLDIVKRHMQFQKYSYAELLDVSKQFGFIAKSLITNLENAIQFAAFYTEHVQRSIADPSPEGYILEDAAGLMVKLKLPYYTFWKYIRGFVENLQKNKHARAKREYAEHPVFIQFKEWILSKDESYLFKSIVELRKEFLSER